MNAQAAYRSRTRQTNGRRHSTGRTRRRWPCAYARAYDGAAPEDPRINPRYQESYEKDRRNADQVRRRRIGGLDQLRRSPIRNGLIGLAVVGTAVPIALNRHQQALRADASHERLYAQQAEDMAVDDQAVNGAWQDMVEEAAADPAIAGREATVQEKMDRFREYGVSREMAEDIYDAAANHDIDPEIAFGLIRAESSFRNTATSPVGAVGLAQLMPKTAAWVEPGTTRSDLRNQQKNLDIGFKYLRQLIDKYNGNEDLALLAYNRGPGTVDRAIKRGQNPDNGYAKFVRGDADHGHKLFTR
jgi:hypothetical protein